MQVHRRPRVAIVSTGSELVESIGLWVPADSQLQQLFSPSPVPAVGVEPTMLGIVADDYESTRQLMQKGLNTTCWSPRRVSVGQFDFVKNIQDELGVERRLWGVAMKPGKPLTFGIWSNTLVFGLPGNPVSVMVSFELFVRPALLRLMGYRKTTRPLHRPSSLKTWWLAIAACSWW